MFTKKHYEVLARLIHHNDTLNGFTADLIVTLRADNPKFDTRKFLEALKR